MTRALLFPNNPPSRFPIVYYNRSFSGGGVPVIATVANLTAPFPEELRRFGDEDDGPLAHGVQ